MTKCCAICICLLTMLFLTHSSLGQRKAGTLQIRFQYIANGKPLVLRDSTYLNGFNESYSVNRLKFYVADVNLGNSASEKNIFLVDAAETLPIEIPVTAGTYQQLSFSIGVDSVQNVSGAQTGALDPLNGMFWTWHSGYIFFKLEGASVASAADLNRIEHHIGGYQGVHRAQRKIELPLPQPLLVKANSENTLTILVDLDKYWQSENNIRIAEQPLIMSPGVIAKKSATNLSSMYSVPLIQ